MYQLAIFDLDGTLLDTLADLRQGINYALGTQGFAPRSMAEVRAFVGNGIRKLVERAVPAGTSEAQMDAVYEAFKIQSGNVAVFNRSVFYADGSCAVFSFLFNLCVDFFFGNSEICFVYLDALVLAEGNFRLYGYFCGKDEILTAILAFKGLVFEHFATSLNMDK